MKQVAYNTWISQYKKSIICLSLSTKTRAKIWVCISRVKSKKMKQMSRNSIHYLGSRLMTIYLCQFSRNTPSCTKSDAWPLSKHTRKSCKGKKTTPTKRKVYSKLIFEKVLNCINSRYKVTSSVSSTHTYSFCFVKKWITIFITLRCMNFN